MGLEQALPVDVENGHVRRVEPQQPAQRIDGLPGCEAPYPLFLKAAGFPLIGGQDTGLAQESPVHCKCGQAQAAPIMTEGIQGTALAAA